MKKSSKSSAAEVVEAPAVASTQAASATTTTSNKKASTQRMSDAPNSIIEYAEDIGDAQPPVPLPVGDYPAEIRAATRKVSQRTGNPYIQVQFFVAPENYPADYTEGNPDGEVLSYQRLSPEDNPRARHRMRKFCEAIGAKTGSKLDLNEWIGLTAIISIAETEYEGEARAEIAKVNPA